jgi:hypothetical protein
MMSAALLGIAAAARGQDSTMAELPVPARAILRLGDSLKLSTPQTTKLQTLARTQIAALAKNTSAFLRAEADLIDASRKDDLIIRRLALEKRAKIAVDGEIARLQGDKDARAVLSADQRTKLQVILDRNDWGLRDDRVALWKPLVTPTPLSRSLSRTERDSIQRDSNVVRLRVVPSFAEIFIDDRLIGTAFKQVWLPVGVHKVKFSAPGCGTPIEQTIEVIKTGQPIILPPVTILGC